MKAINSHVNLCKNRVPGDRNHVIMFEQLFVTLLKCCFVRSVFSYVVFGYASKHSGSVVFILSLDARFNYTLIFWLLPKRNVELSSNIQKKKKNMFTSVFIPPHALLKKIEKIVCKDVLHSTADKKFSINLKRLKRKHLRKMAAILLCFIRALWRPSQA